MKYLKKMRLVSDDRLCARGALEQQGGFHEI
jgi:hypothetical protein